MLSKRSLEVLLDLAENKLSDIVPFDREDVREVKTLHTCVNELRALRGLPPIDIPGGGSQRNVVRNSPRPA
jgi:hypothetical protein